MNLPATRTHTVSLDTVAWHYEFVNMLAAEADALRDHGQPLSVAQNAAVLACDVFLDEWARLAGVAGKPARCVQIR
jgi:hypothetical protein